MQLSHRLQGSRYELKYVISEQRAHAIRDHLLRHLVPDEHAIHLPDHAYSVRSLYLDSEDLALCKATLNGERNRFKLRIRAYDVSSTSPAYFEIKRRVDGAIEKDRAAVPRSAIQRLVAGQAPRASDLWPEEDQSGLRVLHRFNQLQHAVAARARLHVAYRRAAYVVPKGNEVRVTFDRDLTGMPFTGGFDTVDGPPFAVPTGGVILELKFTDQFPGWLRRMVQMFALNRCSVAKYVRCATEVSRLHRGHRRRHAFSLARAV